MKEQDERQEVGIAEVQGKQLGERFCSRIGI